MSRYIVVVVAALLTACGEDFTAPDRSGSMSFTYHGALADSPSGAFSVQGGRNSYPSGAGGYKTTGGISIVGSLGQGAPEFGVSVLGTMAVGPLPTCENSPAPPTPCVFFGYFDASRQSTYVFGSPGQPPDAQMRVTITDLTASRVRGTFEGVAVGYCVECGPYVEDTMTISSGAFDVPYR
jgi:hypothetical protein